MSWRLNKSHIRLHLLHQLHCTIKLLWVWGWKEEVLIPLSHVYLGLTGAILWHQINDFEKGTQKLFSTMPQYDINNLEMISS